jgi:hypothetical protein
VVTYHESFCVAAAAVAPVIALANTVSVTDAARLWLEAKDTSVRKAIISQVYIGILLLSGTIFIAQAFVLYFAFESLYLRRDININGNNVTHGTILIMISSLISILGVVAYSVLLRYLVRPQEAR